MKFKKSFIALNILCLSQFTFAANELQVTPFSGLAVGTLQTTTPNTLPILTFTNDDGKSWIYPSYVFKNLPVTLSSGIFLSSASTGSANDNISIAAGQACTGGFCVRPFPLVAVGTQNGATWNYPSSVYENLTTRITANFGGGLLQGASCFGSGANANCIAPGFYFDDDSGAVHPLLAQSSNGGSDWNYPTSIFTDLNISVDPNITTAFLAHASCTKDTDDSVCIAAGSFCTSIICSQPLIALSPDKGLTWTFPHSIFQNLQTSIDPNFLSAFFNGASCSGKGNKAICIAAGNMFNGENLPLIALTRNGGSDWVYPKAIFTDLKHKINPAFISGYFQSASCIGEANKTTCVAAGAYTEDVELPLVVITRDGGNTWIYPDDILKQIKSTIPNFVRGNFSSVSCTGTSKKGICVASGRFCTDEDCDVSYPLIAASNDGGKSWIFPTSIFKNLKLAIDPKFAHGLLSSVSCSGDEDHSYCQASGEYVTTDDKHLPLVAISTTNSGRQWSYPKAVHNDLTTTIDPAFDFATFVSTATAGELKSTPTYVEIVDHEYRYLTAAK